MTLLVWWLEAYLLWSVGATCYEHTHRRRLAAAAGREPCPAYQDFCYLVLVLPVFTSSVPQGLILKAAACCHI